MATKLGVIALVLAVLVTGCTADWADVRVEHRTGPAPADFTGDDGPAPGILTELWHVDDIPTTTDPTHREAGSQLKSGNLLVFDYYGARAYASTTGRGRLVGLSANSAPGPVPVRWLSVVVCRSCRETCGSCSRCWVSRWC